MMDNAVIAVGGALAWAYTRNIEFTSKVERERIWPLEDAYFRFGNESGKRFMPAVATTYEAWDLLRNAVKVHDLPVSGLVLRQTTHGGDDWEISGDGRPTVLPDICRAMMIEGDDGPLIRLRRDVTGTLLKFEKVHFGRERLFELFPRIPIAFALLEGSQEKQLAVTQRTRAEELIAEAISVLWPDGIPATCSISDRNAEIREQVRKKKSASGAIETVSDSSLYRYFKLYH
jgi:hypothetical protein